jgi:TonB family protein
MFANVRKRLLPALIRERFRTARAALDQKNLSAAEPRLVEARMLIADAETLGVKDEGLADLTVLVDGFLQLVRTTVNQRPSSPAVAANANPADAAATASRQRSEPALPPVLGRAPAANAASAPRVYTVDEVGVTPPVVVSQRMPSMTPELVKVVKAMNVSAVIEVLIDERGEVLDAIVRKSLNSSFDNLIVGAARRWKYRPAMKDGVPVRYSKTIVLVP